ncbi:MAG: hypothetical protein R3C44_09855 [Chloroflexota bacterium]
MVYDGRFLDAALYDQPELTAYEKDVDQTFRAVWLDINDLRRPGVPPIYPDGVLDLLG